MKFLFDKVRVVHDAHMHEYRVEYKCWFRWVLQYSYQYELDKSRPGPTQERAKELAIARAEALMETCIVWERTQVKYY